MRRSPPDPERSTRPSWPPRHLQAAARHLDVGSPARSGPPRAARASPPPRRRRPCHSSRSRPLRARWTRISTCSSSSSATNSTLTPSGKISAGVDQGRFGQRAGLREVVHPADGVRVGHAGRRSPAASAPPPGTVATVMSSSSNVAWPISTRIEPSSSVRASRMPPRVAIGTLTRRRRAPPRSGARRRRVRRCHTSPPSCRRRCGSP